MTTNLSNIRGGGITSRGGIIWAAISTDTLAVRSYGYMINASSNSVTLTLPSSPQAGDQVGVCDSHSMATTNIITINRNGSNILSTSDNLIIDIDAAGFILTYTDITRGWVISDDIGVNVAWGEIVGDIYAQADLEPFLRTDPSLKFYKAETFF